MRLVFFCRSYASGWDHGNGAFLRGLVHELELAGHEVRICEDARTPECDLELIDLDEAIDRADIVIVHEACAPSLVARIGAHRKTAGSRHRLFFHDTGHRSATDWAAMRDLDLSGYDAVLVCGAAIAEIYARSGWAQRIFVWHQAADVRVFSPPDGEQPPLGDVVWIGNWGEGERAEVLQEMLLEPVRELQALTRFYGIKYPGGTLPMLAARGIELGGWLPCNEVPKVLARYRLTVHVPRRTYRTSLPGVPSLRIFEALACGTPLIRASWEDTDHLFTAGEDMLVADDAASMQKHMSLLLADEAARRSLARRGRETILARHTCAHRVRELFAIARELGMEDATPSVRSGPALDARANLNAR